MLNPDVAGGKKVTVYAYDANADLNPGATIDLTSILEFAGGSGKLVFIGSNFDGGGYFNVSIKADGKDVWSINEGLAVWTSKQWIADIEKG